MILGVFDSNDCDFAIKFDDVSKLDLVKELARAGLSAWYQAAHEDIEGDEYFTAEEIEGFYDSGYAEPTCELLDRYGIEYEIVDFEYDENGEAICDEAISYW